MRLRAVQMRALLEELDALGAGLRAAGLRAVLLVGGDLNAVREEFVHGNGDAFYASDGVRAIRPALKRPAHGGEVAAAATLWGEAAQPLASLGTDGALRLACASADGGWLREASAAPAAEAGAAAVACTRSGSSMCIDFLLIGAIGTTCTSAPLAIVPAADVEACADAVDGTRLAITKWGSDHLPVAADLEVQVA